MTPAEVKKLVAKIIRRWPHSDMPPVEEYVADLEMVQAEHAHAAADTIYRDGEKFAPNGAQIIGRIADLALDAPPWGRVKAEIDRRRVAQGGAVWALADRACPVDMCDGRGWLPEDDDTPRHELVASPCPCRERIASDLAEAVGVHPLVVRFIEHVGRNEILALDGDRVAEAQVRDKYEQFIKNVRRGVVYTGVADAGLPGLQRLSLEAKAAAGQLGGGQPQQEISSGGATPS